MAAKQNNNVASDASPVDFNTHARDYGRLIWMLKWGAVTAILIGLFVMFILAN